MLSDSSATDHYTLSPLYAISWHKVRLQLKNIRNVFAREHPLSIFHAVFLSTAGRCNFDKEGFFFHPLEKKLPERICKNEMYDLELVFPISSPMDIALFLKALTEHLADPKNNFEIIDVGTPEKRTLANLEREWGEVKDDEEQICLEFVTPFPFQPKSKDRKWLVDRDLFFRQLANRLKRFYGVEVPPEVWQDIRLLPYYWEYLNIKHKSKSNQGQQFIHGAVGPLYLRGPVCRVLPLLLACAELHGGRRIGNGQGCYVLKKRRPFFDEQVGDLHCFQRFAARLDQESDMADDIAEAYLDKPAALTRLHDDMVKCCLEPRPANGFYVDKRRGGQRLIATLDLQDYLVHKFLASILTPVVDRMFENASVGFRAGRSRDTARKMIRKACSEGYCYVLESDIAAFFDRINWDILVEKLVHCLPLGDMLTLELLKQVIHIPLAVAGKEVERSRGLVQGSPLSPLLSNLYLDSFDEEMEQRGFRLVRYGDDFLVLTRSQEEAEQALTTIREILEPLKLLLKEEKTKTAPVDLGFTFLGISFDAGLDEDYVADSALGKTLYIRHQYAFAGIDGDSLVIRKDKELQARLPLKRISEIVVLGTNTISSRLLGKCAREKIPVSFCSPMGYYYSTLRPDSKHHLQRAARHGSVFSTLEEEEKIQIARRIVTAKLHNYLAWFRERWPAESRGLVHRVETSIASLAKADAVEKIRGYEGEAARRMFSFVNRLCKHTDFHCKKRKKRAREDFYNSLLDFAYSLLFTRLNVLLRSQGLNPYLGILHSHKDNYESLVCDLQEPFRCRMDRFVVKTVNREIIKPDDFEKKENGTFWMKSSAVGKFIQAFEREMGVRLTGDGGTLKQLLTAQVRSVQDWVQGREGLCFYESGAHRNDIWISNPGGEVVE